jgi:hypothetical protein
MAAEATQEDAEQQRRQPVLLSIGHGVLLAAAQGGIG